MSNKKKLSKKKAGKTLPSNSVKIIAIVSIVLICLIIIPVTILTSKNQTHYQGYAATTTTQITVNEANPGITIPSSFNGLGFETSDLCNLISTDKQGSTLANLFTNLGSTIMRFGANSVENTSWSPSGSPSCSYTGSVITQSLVNDTFAFARKVNWKVIWGENLKNGNPASDADQAAYVINTGGANLLALEIGNEPDLYGIPYSTFRTNWDSFASAIKTRTPTAPLSGPASSYQVSWTNNFVADESSNIMLATQHLYPMGVNDSSQTITKLLSEQQRSDTANTIDQVVGPAKAHNLPLQIDESNNIANGGTPGVSNVYASALWAADYLFTAAEHGAVGVNMFGGDTYEPLHITGSSVTVQPEYYGLLLYHYAAGNGTVIPVQINSPLNVTAYAVLGNDNKLRITIFNKDLSNSTTVQITTTKAYTQASAIRLTAPSISATTGVTLGGSSVANDGTWSPSVSEPVIINGATASIDIPASSAAVITYETSTAPSATQTPLPTTTPTPSPLPIPTTAPTVKPTNRPTPISSANKISIYTDSLSSGWINWSSQSSINFANTSPIYSGSRSIAWKATAGWGTLYLHTNTPISTIPYTFLHFAAQAVQSGQTYGLWLYDQNGTAQTHILLANYGGNPIPGSWKVYNIPLTALGMAGKSITGFDIQNWSNKKNQLLYLDDIAITP